jgi:hypothetical protein
MPEEPKASKKFQGNSGGIARRTFEAMTSAENDENGAGVERDENGVNVERKENGVGVENNDEGQPELYRVGDDLSQD